MDEEPAHNCVDQHAAAKLLGVSLARVALLIVNDHLEVCGACGKSQVTGQSIQGEQTWRTSAPLWRRCVRPLRDSVNWF